MTVKLMSWFSLVRTKEKTPLLRCFPLWLPELAWFSDSCIPLCGIGRCEEMGRVVSTASVIRSNHIPSRPFTVSLRSKQWLLSWCHGSAWFGQKKKHRLCGVFLYGSPNWARTSDIMINSHALYRLSYRGIGGAPPGTRTLDPLIKSQLLYQLS